MLSHSSALNPFHRVVALAVEDIWHATALVCLGSVLHSSDAIILAGRCSLVWLIRRLLGKGSLIVLISTDRDDNIVLRSGWEWSWCLVRWCITNHGWRHWRDTRLSIHRRLSHWHRIVLTVRGARLSIVHVPRLIITSCLCSNDVLNKSCLTSLIKNLMIFRWRTNYFLNLNLISIVLTLISSEFLCCYWPPS